MAPHPPITILKRPHSSSSTPSNIISKSYLRKTARGKVQKVLREHYLRSDIPCGSSLCHACKPLYALSTAGLPTDGEDEGAGIVRVKRRKLALLDGEGRKGHSLFKGAHYLVLDTNIVLNQIDLLEAPAFGAGLIVPQTVLEELRARSLPLFNRLSALLNETDASGTHCRGWVFSNEARSDTHVTLLSADEVINDRNDRAIRVATKWYGEHLKPYGIGVVLLSDDKGNRTHAEAEGLRTSATRDYVDSMATSTTVGASSVPLSDLVALPGSGFDRSDADGASASAKGKQRFFEEYYSSGTLEAGVKGAALHAGVFHPNTYNYLEGTVTISSTSPSPLAGKQILLVGREAMNRSVDGDQVVVELLPESEWKAPADEVVESTEAGEENVDPDEDVEGEGVDEGKAEKKEKALASSKAPSARQPTGRVVGVLKRQWRPYVCHLDSSSLSSSSLQSTLSTHSIFVTPLSRLLPKIRVRTRQASSLAGQKFLVSLDRWDTTSRFPEGHFVRLLGKVESKEAEQESLLLEFEVPYRPFSKAVLDGLPDEGESWVVPPKEASGKVWVGREDLREKIICSIDPPGCQDIDDALHAKWLENGNIEAGVHIADVSHFVLADTPMDAEAASRGTTVYLVDKRIDMLPALLGTNLCSLRPFVERLAFSVIWELDPKTASIVSVRFTKSVIASKAAFTYEEAQKRKDNLKLTDDITVGVRLLNDLAIKLRKARMDAGALNLASPEVKVHMESSESSDPVDVEQKEMMETNSLVEEFMLLANISVAKRIYESFPQTAVLRHHGAPPKANFEVLQDVLMKRKSMKLDVSSSGALADSLDQCIDPDLPSFNTLVRIMATRCMLSAQYFGAGSVSKESFVHYGLASPIYTHFTSPIRRYADVLAHRQLYAAITKTPLHPSMHSKPFVEKIMDNLNRRHSAAQKAGRASVEFYVALAIKAKEEAGIKSGKGKVRAEAFVIRAFRNGLAVFVSQFGLEGLVKFKRDTTYDADTYEIAVPNDPTEPSGPTVRIGVFDKVTVEISVEKDRNTQRGRVKMTLVDPVNSEAI